MFEKGSLLFVVGLYLVVHIVMADSTGPDDAQCMEACLTDLQQRAPKLDAATVLSIGHIKSGNQTVTCPKHDGQMTNSTCGPYQDAVACFAKCPDGQIKALSMSGFAPLQLVCVDRKDDFERYMPCLSQNCVSAQAMCQPKCGSFDDLSRDFLRMLQRVRGTSFPNQNGNSQIDPTNITMIIDNACGSIECYADCSRNATVSQCGQDAYNLEMQTVWTIFASMTQSMSSIGLSTPWPESCKTLATRSGTWTKSAVTAPPPTTGIPRSDDGEDPQTVRSNSVRQFDQKNQTDNVEVTVNGNGTVTPSCKDGACGSTGRTISSMSMLVMVAAALLALK